MDTLKDFRKTASVTALMVAALVVCWSGCGTTSSGIHAAGPPLEYSDDVRRQSSAGDALFHDLLADRHGVGFLDRRSYPKANVRTLENIEVIVPYNNVRTGFERWTIRHDEADNVSYLLRFAPDGFGGTTFSVTKDKTKSEPQVSKP
jgi:hypothetical protein